MRYAATFFLATVLFVPAYSQQLDTPTDSRSDRSTSLIGIVIRGSSGLSEIIRPYAEDFIRSRGDEVGLSYDEIRRISREYDQQARNKWVENPPELGSLRRPDAEAVFTFSTRPNSASRSGQLGGFGSGQVRTNSVTVEVTVTYRDSRGRTLRTLRGSGSAEDTSYNVSVRTRKLGTIRIGSQTSRQEELRILASQRAISALR